jgi:hypothetical protein
VQGFRVQREREERGERREERGERREERGEKEPNLTKLEQESFTVVREQQRLLTTCTDRARRGRRKKRERKMGAGWDI